MLESSEKQEVRGLKPLSSAVDSGMASHALPLRSSHVFGG